MLVKTYLLVSLPCDPDRLSPKPLIYCNFHYTQEFHFECDMTHNVHVWNSQFHSIYVTEGQICYCSNVMLTCWQLLATIQHNPHLTPNLVHLLAHYEDAQAGRWQQKVLYCLVVLLKSVTVWIECEWNCYLESHDELMLLFLMMFASAEDWDQIWVALWTTRNDISSTSLITLITYKTYAILDCSISAWLLKWETLSTMARNIIFIPVKVTVMALFYHSQI